MLTYEKQALSGTIEVLLRSELPDEFEGTKLYGSVEEDELRQDCKIFRLSNETGHGRITVYQVFSGIELYYNDMHMGYCNQNQATAKNMIEINHCLIGRFECSFGENSCCYMAEGDLSISSMMKKKSNSCFPLNHYHGISIVINLDELLPEIRQIMELLNNWINGVNDILWSYILIIMLLGCAVWFTIKSRFVQFRMIGEMIRLLGDSAGKGEKGEKHISSFQAFAVSLASRVGTGNLAGVATAVAIGGPGSVFWMWLIALLGCLLYTSPSPRDCS